jgi:hypothetical protein
MSTPIENALVIPQQATFEVLDKKFVFVVENQGDKHVVRSREIAGALDQRRAGHEVHRVRRDQRR